MAYQSTDFNLLDESWIPVLWNNGKVNRVSIKTVLSEAGNIRDIAAGNPMDRFAIIRFLLALLYWKAEIAGGVKQVRESLLNDGLPSAVVDGISKETHRFDLFDKEAPFLQDASVSNTKERDKKSVGSLFAELASGTNIAHFNHGDDDNMRLCLPCAALGLLRVIPWSQAGGPGISPSVHNAPPIMTLALGDNLTTTLGLNLVPLNATPGTPQWSGYFKPTDPIGSIPYMEAFTWNPRRILLPKPGQGTCWYCGLTSTVTVGKIVYMKNEYTKQRGDKSDKRLFEWEDPAAFYAPYDVSGKYDKSKNAPYKTIKSSRENLAVDGRDLSALSDNNRSCLPNVARSNPDHHNWLMVIPSTNPANNKTFDHRQLELPNLSPETIRFLLPAARSQLRQGMDGWDEPNFIHQEGARQFVQAAANILLQADWALLSNAAYLDMHKNPAAFDVFSALFWGLREKKIAGLPSAHVAWLMLKLMAAVPAHARAIRADASFSPLPLLPKRQLHERDRPSLYPVSFPRGVRLEASLQNILLSNSRKRNPKPVDWIGLCYGLDQLID